MFGLTFKVKKTVRYVFLLCFFFCIGAYFYAHYKGAEKGIESYLFSINLPYNLHPFVDGHSSFVLKDSSDIEVIGIGFRFVTMTSPIQDIIAYGYNDFSIIVLCDYCDCKKSFISYIDKYNSVSFKEISYTQLQNNDYHWVNIENTDYNNFTKMKSWFFILSFFLFLLQY